MPPSPSHLKHEEMATAEVAREFWASLALFWYFLAAFVAPSQLPTTDSWCISQPLVFSTFKNSCCTQVPAGPVPQCVYVGNVCKILVLVRAGEELIFTVDGMRLCFEFELKAGFIMATSLKPGCWSHAGWVQGWIFFSSSLVVVAESCSGHRTSFSPAFSKF